MLVNIVDAAEEIDIHPDHTIDYVVIEIKVLQKHEAGLLTG